MQQPLSGEGLAVVQRPRLVDVSALNGGNPGALIFGPNDGNYRDNSGKFDITLYQLGTSAVPEPATWAMMITGFGLAGMAVRRRRLAPKSALTCNPRRLAGLRRAKISNR